MANWLTGKVIENRRHNDYLTALVIDVDLGGYEAGQFVRIGLPDGEEVLARPYSLVNTPGETYLEVYFNLVEEGMQINSCHTLLVCFFDQGEDLVLMAVYATR